MKRWMTRHGEKGLLALSFLLLVASSGWVIRRLDEIRRIRSVPVALKPAGLPLAAEEPSAPMSGTASWRPPGAGKGGGVFDPPTKAAENGREKTRESAGNAIDLELLAVRREPFRLQLAGYVGEPGAYWAVFNSPGDPENLLGRDGERFANLGLTLRKFTVATEVVEQTAAGPVRDRVARAMVVDDATGTEVVLDSRYVRLTDQNVASLRGPAGAPPREVRTGESIAVGGVVFRIDRIQADPPEVDLVIVGGGPPRAEKLVIRPPASGSRILANEDPTDLPEISPPPATLAGGQN